MFVLATFMLVFDQFNRQNPLVALFSSESSPSSPASDAGNPPRFYPGISRCGSVAGVCSPPSASWAEVSTDLRKGDKTPQQSLSQKWWQHQQFQKNWSEIVMKLWTGEVPVQNLWFVPIRKDPDRLSFPSPAWLLEAPFSTFQAVDDQFSSCGLPRFRSDSLEKETLEAKGDVPKKPMERGWEIPRTKWKFICEHHRKICENQL